MQYVDEPRAADVGAEADGVVITGVDMSFYDLIALLTKVGLAAIPAILIVSTVVALVTAIFAASLMSP